MAVEKSRIQSQNGPLKILMQRREYSEADWVPIFNPADPPASWHPEMLKDWLQYMIGNFPSVADPDSALSFRRNICDIDATYIFHMDLSVWMPRHIYNASVSKPGDFMFLIYIIG